MCIHNDFTITNQLQISLRLSRLAIDNDKAPLNSKALVTIYLSSRILTTPILKYKQGRNLGAKFYITLLFCCLVFPIPVMTPPLLPIHRSINDHTCSFFGMCKLHTSKCFQHFPTRF